MPHLMSHPSSDRPRRIVSAGAAAILATLASPSGPGLAEPGKALAPIPAATLAIMTQKETSPAAPLVIRTYKKEAELEIWKRNAAGRYVYIKTFPICRWSGQLGPKMKPGDRQTPEGFYAVGPRQMNPNSHYYLSFDTGFPNAYDRAQGASGSAVMVHGTCSSMGCFAMTDKQVGEIYAIAREALKGGQAAFQLQAYPFHMSARNMALYRNDRNIAFWRQLKDGSDRFEAGGQILDVGVADRRYTFAPSRDPRIEKAVQAFHAHELEKIAALVKDGSAAVATTYADGGQNAIFAALLRRGANLGTVSRPEALAYAGIDVTLVPARRPRPPTPWPVRLDIVVAEWKPDPAPVRPLILKVRVATVLPGSIGPAIVAAPLPRVPFQPGIAGVERMSLIAGAIPMRGATWAN